MGCLREIFDTPVVGPGLRGDTVLPPRQRRDGTLAPPAAFAFDPAQERDAAGRWGAAGAAGGADAPATPPLDRAAGAPVPLVAAATAWKLKLSTAEAGAVLNYTSGGYHKLNSPLRQEPSGLSMPPADFEVARSVAAAVARFPVGGPVTSWRGVRMRDPKRLKTFTKALDAAAKTGGVVTLNGFSSATLDPDLAARWGDFVLRIDSPRGAYVGPAAADPTEEEVLHQHGDQFCVVGVRETHYQARHGEGRTRTTYHLQAVPTPPACPLLPAPFAWDPDKHPRGELGRWAETGSESEPGPGPGSSEPPAPVEARPFPATASYARGRGLAAVVAAMPDDVAVAEANVARLKADFKRWPKDHPDLEPFGDEHRATFKFVADAENAERHARRAARESFLASYGKIQPVAWAPDTADLKAHNWNRPFFTAALEFVKKLVPAATGADPRLIVADGRGPCYQAAGPLDDAGVIVAPPRTSDVAFAHELGHHLEHTVPGAQALCNEFLRHRAAGEQPHDLAALGLTQAAGATGYKDSFDRVFGPKRGYYAGRVYPNGANEILAMGLEALYDDPVGFAKKDPEYFAFVIGVISGDLLGKGASHAR